MLIIKDPPRVCLLEVRLTYLIFYSQCFVLAMSVIVGPCKVTPFLDLVCEMGVILFTSQGFCNNRMRTCTLKCLILITLLTIPNKIRISKVTYSFKILLLRNNY